MLHHEKNRQKAFTLIELIVVITLMAVMSVSTVVIFSQAQKKAIFRDHQTQIMSIYQKARALSISSQQVEGEPAVYYRVLLFRTFIILSGQNESGITDEIARYTFVNGYRVDKTSTTYYFPPYGDVCFSATCTDGKSQVTFTLSATGTDYSSTMSISAFSGLPELVEGDL